jgi:CDP-glucose 4,6-dehydratase
MGAQVFGYSLAPNTSPNLFSVLGLETLVHASSFNNICDLAALKTAVQNARPEIVIHMAAQALVRHSYQNPVETYATNVMGTVHLLEAIRAADTVRATVIVTTDKCYENKEWVWGYRENEPMGGHDPYSSSKGCAELVTSAYIRSFFSSDTSQAHQNSIATARAGNVIGGGDWSEDRLIPDAFKAFERNEMLKIRNPLATRPWQHVLEPLTGYLILAQKLYQEGLSFSGAWNFGPKSEDNCEVKDIIGKFIESFDPSAKWCQDSSAQPHEARSLRLDCTKANEILGWQARWNLDLAIHKVAVWYQAFRLGKDMKLISLEQIRAYQEHLIN